MRPAKEFKGGEFKPRDKRGGFDRGGETGGGGRASKLGKGFGAPPGGAAPQRPGRGEFKRSSGGGFQRTGPADFKHPGSKRPDFKRLGINRPGLNRSSASGRFGRSGGAAPRPPRRRPEQE